MRGIDTDNYDGPIPVEHFEMLHRDYGVDFNIIGLEASMPYAFTQRQASEAAGIRVPLAYKFLYWTPNDLARMLDACRFGKPIAIDCEFAGGMAGGPGATVERIGQARELLKREGLYWGIYTGSWWWDPMTGDSQDFAGDQLWHAAYPFNRPGRPPVLPPADYMPSDFSVNYGGWTQATIWQYADVCYGDELGPWDLDLNAWNPALLKPEEGTAMNQPTLEEALTALVNAGAIMATPAPGRSLEELTAKDVASLEWIVATAKGPRV